MLDWLYKRILPDRALTWKRKGASYYYDKLAWDDYLAGRTNPHLPPPLLITAEEVRIGYEKFVLMGGLDDWASPAEDEAWKDL